MKGGRIILDRHVTLPHPWQRPDTHLVRQWDELSATLGVAAETLGAHPHQIQTAFGFRPDRSPRPEILKSFGRGDATKAGQAPGGKNTSVRTSMLSRGGAPGVSGFSNEVWNDSRARPSLALSWTRINSTSSVCCSEK